MPDSDDPAKRREADNPTRLQRVARRGCVGLAYAIVLVPVVLVIWFFSTIPRGWEQFGDLVWKVISEGSPGAHTQITIVNESGHDVQIDLMQFDEVPVAFSRPLESFREGDGEQKSIHYQAIYFQDINLSTSLCASATGRSIPVVSTVPRSSSTAGRGNAADLLLPWSRTGHGCRNASALNWMTSIRLERRTNLPLAVRASEPLYRIRS